MLRAVRKAAALKIVVYEGIVSNSFVSYISVIFHAAREFSQDSLRVNNNKSYKSDYKLMYFKMISNGGFRF